MSFRKIIAENQEKLLCYSLKYCIIYVWCGLMLFHDFSNDTSCFHTRTCVYVFFHYGYGNSIILLMQIANGCCTKLDLWLIICCFFIVGCYNYDLFFAKIHLHLHVNVIKIKINFHEHKNKIPIQMKFKQLYDSIK